MRVLAGLIGSIAVLASAGVAHAGLLGETVNFDRVLPDLPFDYNIEVGQTGDYIVGVSAPLALSGGDNEYVSAGDDTITYLFGPQAGTGFDLGPHLIIFTESAMPIFGVSVLSTSFTSLTGFDPSDISFTANSVTLDIQKFEYTGSNTLVLKLDLGQGTDSGVPEPGVWACMIVGFAGAGAALRRRRAAFQA